MVLASERRRILEWQPSRERVRYPTVRHSPLKSQAVLSDRLELFFGEATAAEARVYARLDGSKVPADATLAGHLIGPECRFARTLPAKIPFQFRGRSAGGELLTEVIVPDPCFWTPDLAGCWHRVESKHGESCQRPGISPTCQAEAPPTERWFGIRRLGVRGESLYLDGQRWVLRGEFRKRADLKDLAVARASDAALVVAAADDGFCLEASRQGVPLVVMVSGRGGELANEIYRLGNWPAVFLVVLDAEQPADFDPRLLARNLLFAAHYRADRPLGSSTWAHVLWREIENEQASVRYAGSPRPIIAVRRLPDQADIPTTRGACDRLQLELAPFGNFAGYVV